MIGRWGLLFRPIEWESLKNRKERNICKETCVIREITSIARDVPVIFDKRVILNSWTVDQISRVIAFVIFPRTWNE